MKTKILIILTFIICSLAFPQYVTSNENRQTYILITEFQTTSSELKNFDKQVNKILQHSKTATIPTYICKGSLEDCDKIQKKLKNREDILSAYKDKQLLDHAKKNNMSVEKYDNAIWNLALWIRDCKPYEPGTMSDEQIEDFFNTQLEPGSSVTVMRADFDGTIKAPDPNKPNEWIIIIDKYGEKTSAYNLVRTKFINTHGKNAGKAFFEEAEAHEKSHQEFYKDNSFGETPAGFQNHEVWAYKASIKSLNKSLKELGCDEMRGSIEYNHNIKFNYGTFSQTVIVTGSVPFKLYLSPDCTQDKQQVKGKGTVNLSLIWTAEDCVGRSDSPGEIEFEGEIIKENEEKFIDIKFDEKWYQNSVLTVTCPEVTKSVPMTIPPPVKYENMKFKFNDGEKITRPFAGMGGNGTYSWTIRLPDSVE